MIASGFLFSFFALLSHWRRKPLQLAAVLVGLASATALWSGVQALNIEAKRSYARAAALAGGEGAISLAAPGGGRFEVALFAKLRRAGWRVSPILEGRLALADGLGRLRVLGVDPVSAPRGSSVAGVLFREEVSGGVAFIRPPWRGLLSPQTFQTLGLRPGARLPLANGQRTPPLFPADTVPPRTLLLDIGAAEALLGVYGRIDRLLLDPHAPRPATALEEATQGRLVLSKPPEQDFGRLTESFHLNLTAFGLLSFAVGLFIAHASIGLAFEQRKATIRTVRALGVSARAMSLALLTETLGFALIAGTAGLVFGYFIAGALAPGVAATLGGLYGAPVAGGLAFDPIWALWGLAMTLFGAFAAAGQSLWKTMRLPLLSSAGAEAWRVAQRRWLIRQGAAGAVLLALGVILAARADGLLMGFALLAALLLGAALVLPALLAIALEAGRAAARSPVALWFWSDARREISGLSLALAALLLALSANIGVGAMVGGFRQAFDDWLDARLSADIYVRADTQEQTALMRDWAAARPEMRAVLPQWSADIRMSGAPVELRGYLDHAIFRRSWTMLSAEPEHWEQFASGEAAFISEQLARRLDLKLGDHLQIPNAAGGWDLTVAAIYADYGNPLGQISLYGPEMQRRLNSAEIKSFGLIVANGAVQPVLAALRAEFGLSRDGAIDQRSLKVFALSAFEQTFAVTAALNALTFIVAGIALLTSLASLSGQRLAQLSPLWAMGMTRERLAMLDLAQTAALALATAVIAIPVGMALAWALVAVVNVEAFGWRLPLKAFPLEWLRLVALALLAAILAAAPGYWRLRRAAPSRMLRLLAEER